MIIIALYKNNHKFVTFIDIDECAIGTDNCDENANCTNNEGSFSCRCRSSYFGDGITCLGETITIVPFHIL